MNKVLIDYLKDGVLDASGMPDEFMADDCETTVTAGRQPPRRKRFLRNKSGMDLIQILIAVAIIGILFTMGFVGLSAIEKARVVKCSNELSNFTYGFEQALMDHPRMIDQVETAKGSKSIDFARAVNLVNDYLDEAYWFDPATGLSKKLDPWQMPYEIYFSALDLELDSEGISSIKTVDNTDTEFRVIVKSCGKNTTIARTTVTGGSGEVGSLAAVGQSVLDQYALTEKKGDDKIAITQMVNGNVKSGTYGLSEDKATMHFGGTLDVPDFDLANACVE